MNSRSWHVEPCDHGTVSDDHLDRDEPARVRREAEIRDHLANERTLLAWQRTALAVIGIGFLVDRFALGSAAQTQAGSLLGTALIVLGAGVALLGAYRFMRTEREIDTHTYRPALLAHLALTGAVVIGAMGLALFVQLTPVE
jgi:putative membrane protein